MGGLNVVDDSVVVLMSGGIDSTSLIMHYIERDVVVRGIHFQYGQPVLYTELESVKKISRYFNIDVQVCELGFSPNPRGSEFIGRNALFVLSAASLLKPGEQRIALGIHTGVEYYDCTSIFVNHCQLILDGYFGGTVSLEVPFIKLTKGQIFEYARQKKLPFHLTYSCEFSEYVPCGKCSSCRDREVLLRGY